MTFWLREKNYLKDESKAIYKLRKEKVELPFGANKNNLTGLSGTLQYYIGNSGPKTESGGGDEYARLNFSQEPPKTYIEQVKVFIAHGGKSPALEKLKDFLEALGVQPLVVEEQASEDRSVGENVDWYSKQACCAVILATKGDIDSETSCFIPRGNVLMEIGKLGQLFKGRIIYLLQSGTKFPSNVSEKVWVTFSPAIMDKAFIKVARELTAFGIIKTVKP